MFSLGGLLAAGSLYLLLLFVVAHAAERGWIGQRLLAHPVVYVLSIGVFASAFAIYGAVDLAHEYGYGFLAYYVGAAGTFVFAPLVLTPLLHIGRRYQLSSLADLLTFRFRSQWAGSLTTLGSLLAVLPLLALQIQAVSSTALLLTTSHNPALASQQTPDSLALVFCLAITAFAILFGARHRADPRHHRGLVATMALDAIVKTGVLLAVGLVALFGVFDGPLALEQWLSRHDEVLARLAAPLRQDSARALMLTFFAAALCAPHLFHMIHVETSNPRSLQVAAWGVPLLLLLLSLPILPILWAGVRLDPALPPTWFTLAVAQAGGPALTLAVFIAGLSAATAATVVLTLAVASMCLNHLILPIYQPGRKRDIYHWLLWLRRLLMAAIILAGYAFYRLLDGSASLADLAMTGFIGTLQLLPGVLAVLYWPRANRQGLTAGMLTGLVIWALALLLPLLTPLDSQALLQQLLRQHHIDLWSLTALLSLGLNTTVFALVSLFTPISDEERAAAEVCALDDLNRPVRRTLSIRSPAEMKQRLARSLGPVSATREVDRALAALGLDADERRPFALRRLRNRLEINLSGLMGPSVAHDIINRLLPYETPGGAAQEDINLIEIRLERYKSHLTGLAADLDSLRRHHRRTLEELPIGLCSLGRDREILMWNQAMGALSGIDGAAVVGSHLSSLPSPWWGLLEEFFNSPEDRRDRRQVLVGGQPRWLSLQKASSHSPQQPEHDGQVLVVEDITETRLLEQKLMHSERLASIGHLAAGVAHEIGNPVTGIDCLAQNLRHEDDFAEVQATATEILQQTARITRIVQTLVNFAHAGVDTSQQEHEPVTLHACVAEAIHLLELNRDAPAMEFINHCDASLQVLGDPQRLQQVFVNLLTNARDASPPGSVIAVHGKRVRDQAHLTVTDPGSGITRATLDQVFDPFYTTKTIGQGTGLGLALVYSIVEELGGTIELISPVPELGQGTRVKLILPALTGADAPAS